MIFSLIETYTRVLDCESYQAGSHVLIEIHCIKVTLVHFKRESIVQAHKTVLYPIDDLWQRKLTLTPLLSKRDSLSLSKVLSQNKASPALLLCMMKTTISHS